MAEYTEEQLDQLVDVFTESLSSTIEDLPFLPQIGVLSGIRANIDDMMVGTLAHAVHMLGGAHNNLTDLLVEKGVLKQEDVGERPKDDGTRPVDEDVDDDEDIDEDDWEADDDEEDDQ